MERSLINKQKNTGFSLVEILVAVSIFLIFFSVSLQATITFGRYSRHSADKLRALSLAEEGLEAARSIRDTDYALLNNGTFGISTTTGTFSFVSFPDISGIFTRSLSVTSADPNTKMLQATVSWADTLSDNNTVTLSTYLSNWRKYTPLAGLTVFKQVINHGGNKTAQDFAPFMAGTTTLTLGTASSLAPGTYTISENTDPNYSTSWSGDCEPSGNVTMTIGGAKSCTITNEEKRAYIIIIPIVSGGGYTSANFAPYKVGSTTVATGTPVMFDSGTYIVSEMLSSAYTTVWSGDCTSAGSVTLSPGTTKTCTVTNTYSSVVTPDLTFSVTNNNNNTNYIFTGTISGSTNDPNLTFRRGSTYVFNVNAPGQPFWIKTGRANRVTGSANRYDVGVTNNGTDIGQIVFTVPMNAPASDLYYISGNRSLMSGTINTVP